MMSASLTAKEQLEFHTRQMIKTRYQRLPTLAPPPVTSLVKLFNKKALALAFTNTSDERDAAMQGTVKPIHAEGVSAAVQYAPTDFAKLNYTGIYASGGMGILRLSLATAKESSSFTPGLALKIFVDERPSVNFHAMYSLDGQGLDTNFFSHKFATTVDKPRGCILKAIAYSFHRSLAEISPDAGNRPVNERTLPLLEGAKITAQGMAVVEAIAPATLFFVPKVASSYIANTTTPDEGAGDFRNDIMNHVKSPQTIYEIQDENKNVLGDVILISDFMASSHGDNMAFKHQQVSG
jgi:hypothetical protein